MNLFLVWIVNLSKLYQSYVYRVGIHNLPISLTPVSSRNFHQRGGPSKSSPLIPVLTRVLYTMASIFSPFPLVTCGLPPTLTPLIGHSPYKLHLAFFPHAQTTLKYCISHTLLLHDACPLQVKKHTCIPKKISFHYLHLIMILMLCNVSHPVHTNKYSGLVWLHNNLVLHTRDA